MTTTAEPICHCAAFARAHGNGSNAVCGRSRRRPAQNFFPMPLPVENRARAYLAKLPPAVAGNGGHRATFAAACRLVEFGLTIEQAAPLFAAWNETHCSPKWTETELSHKLADAFKRTVPKPEFISAQVKSHSPLPVHRPVSKSPLISNPSAPNFQEPELVTLAPRFHAGTSQELDALATMRGLSRAGIDVASSRGLLRFGRYHGAPAWIVLDQSHRNGCARRV